MSFFTNNKDNSTEDSEKALRLIKNNPNRVPVIIKKMKHSHLPDIDKDKYLVPSDMTLAQFMVILRKKIKLDAGDAIFIFTKNDTLVPTSSIMSSVYEDFKSVDNFLYLYYIECNTFG